jgi:hypothetical protein
MDQEEIIDLFRLNRDEYIAPKSPRLVRSLQSSYVKIQGEGGPDDEMFGSKKTALYTIAHALQKAWEDIGQQFLLCKFEVLWTGPEENGDIFSISRDRWRWTQMIRVPYFVQPEDVEDVAAEVMEKHSAPFLKDVFLEQFKEGLCVQMAHHGAFEKEAETVAAMKRFANKEGMPFHGAHHQIYLSDMQEKTDRFIILRHPLREKTFVSQTP